MNEKLLVKALNTERGKKLLADALLRPIRNWDGKTHDWTEEETRKNCQNTLDIVNKKLEDGRIMDNLERTSCVEVKSKMEAFLAKK